MLELHFRGCLHRFWNCSTFLIHIVSRWTTASSNDLSIFSNPSDFKALSVCLSITFPHQSTRFFSSYLWAVGFVVHPLPVKSARCSNFNRTLSTQAACRSKLDARSSCSAVLRCWKWRNVPLSKTVEHPDCRARQAAEEKGAKSG